MNITETAVPHEYRNRFLRDAGGTGGNTIINNNGGSSSGGTGSNFVPRYLWGQYFDDTKDIDGSMTVNGTVTANSGNINSIYGNQASYMKYTGPQGNLGKIDFISGEQADYKNVLGKQGTIDELYGTQANYDVFAGAQAFLDYIAGNQAYYKLYGGPQGCQAIIDIIKSKNITTEYLTVTKAAHFFKLIIDEIKASKGQVIITPSNAVLDYVEDNQTIDIGGTVHPIFMCYFRSKDGDGKEIYNTFEADDQVICQTFNVATGVSYNVSNKYYWRRCYATSSQPISMTINGETNDYHWIALAKDDMDDPQVQLGDLGNPAPGDEIVVLGNRTDTTRQAAIIISAYNNTYLDPNIESPSIVQYDGINDYDLSTHRKNVISKTINSFVGSFVSSTSGENLEDLVDQPVYTHTAYANSADGSLDFIKATDPNYDPSVSYSYIGWCTDRNASDSSLTYSDYTWSLISGAVGPQGTQGPQGNNGPQGPSAANAFYADLDNEMDSIGCDSDGIPQTGVNSVSTTASLYDGDSKLTSTINIYDTTSSGSQYTNGSTTGGITVSWNNSTGLINVVFSTSATFNITKKVFCIEITSTTLSPNITKYLYFTVNLLKAAKPGESPTIYNLLPSESQIKLGRNVDNTLLPSTYTLKCGYTEHTGTTVNTVEDATGQIGSDYRIFFRRNPQKLIVINSIEQVAINGNCSYTNNGDGSFTISGNRENNGKLVLKIGLYVSYSTSLNITVKASSESNRDFGAVGLKNSTNLESATATTIRNDSGTIALVKSSGDNISMDTNVNLDAGQCFFEIGYFKDSTISYFSDNVTITFTENTSSSANVWKDYVTNKGTLLTNFNTALFGSIDFMIYRTQSTGDINVVYANNVIDKENVPLVADGTYGINGTQGPQGNNGQQGPQGVPNSYYTLSPAKEQATVTYVASAGENQTKYPVVVNLEYNILHIEGTTITVVTPSTTGIYARVQASNLGWRTLDGSNTHPMISDSDFLNGPSHSSHHNYGENNTYTPVNLTVELVNAANNNEVLDTRSIPVIFNTKTAIDQNEELNTITLKVMGNGSTENGLVNDVATLQLEQDQITSEVTSFRQGDTNNLFYPACYNSTGMTDSDNRWLLSNTSNGTSSGAMIVNINNTKYGVPIIDSKTGDITAMGGDVYLYSPYIEATNGYYYTFTFDSHCSTTDYVKLKYYRYSTLAAAKEATGSTSIKSITNDLRDRTYNVNVNKDKYNTSSYPYFRLCFVISNGYTLNVGRISCYKGTTTEGTDAGKFAEWFDQMSKVSSTISQTADSISMGVKNAGIDITTGKITSIADKFEWKDNEGNTVLGMEGTVATFSGTVKAANFYHALCVWSPSNNYSNDCWYCYNNTSDPDFNVFNVGSYYTKQQVYDMTGGLYGQPPDTNFTPCSGISDIIYLTSNSQSWSDTTSNNGIMNLPKAEDYEGKVIEVFMEDYGLTNKQCRVGSVIDNDFALGYLYVDSNGNIQISTGSTGYPNTITINQGTLVRFISVRTSGVPGHPCHWVKIGTI